MGSKHAVQIDEGPVHRGESDGSEQEEGDDVETAQHEEEEEEHEIAVVVIAHRVGHPGTVVIHVIDASAQDTAVMSSWGFDALALVAVSVRDARRHAEVVAELVDLASVHEVDLLAQQTSGVRTITRRSRRSPGTSIIVEEDVDEEVEAQGQIDGEESRRRAVELRVEDAEESQADGEDDDVGPQEQHGPQRAHGEAVSRAHRLPQTVSQRESTSLLAGSPLTARHNEGRKSQ